MEMKVTTKCEATALHNCLQDKMATLMRLRMVAADFCCGLPVGVVKHMSAPTRRHLCDLAMLAGCTHVPWWLELADEYRDGD